MKRVHECKYDDSLKKSRTQLLREKVVVLEAKLRDLENESSYSPQGMSPISLSDCSVDSLDYCPDPSLSADMHNTLYVVRQQNGFLPLTVPKYPNFHQTSLAMLFLHKH